MKINWTITKKRGNHRSSLNYHISLETFEKDLAVHAVCIQSLIPKIPNSHQSFCLPNENERHPKWMPALFHSISVPYFKNGEISEFIRLPFRSSGEYPEVKASFLMLQEQFEKIVQQAYGHAPVDIQDELDISPETKTRIAPGVAAQKMLKFCA